LNTSSLTHTNRKARYVQQPDRHEKLDEIKLMIKEGNLNLIRAKSIQMIKERFVRQIKELFQTLGYSFGSHDVQTDDYCEWIIKIPARRGFDSILVRWIERQAEIDDLKGVQSAVEQHQTDEGWLVAAHRKSQSACEMADQDEKIFCFTFDELLDEHADFSRYFSWLEGFINERNIDADYVPLACR